MDNRKKKDYTIDLDEGREAYDNASIRALERIADLGIDVSTEDRPKNKDGSYFDGRLPSNISDFSMAELARVYGQMDQHANWISDYVALARAELKNKEEKLKLTKARVRKSKVGAKDVRDDETTCDTRFQDENTDWVEAWGYHHLLDNVEKAARRNMATISRLVETAKVGFEQGRRAGNITRRDRFSRKDRGDDHCDDQQKRPRKRKKPISRRR